MGLIPEPSTVRRWMSMVRHLMKMLRSLWGTAASKTAVWTPRVSILVTGSFVRRRLRQFASAISDVRSWDREPAKGEDAHSLLWTKFVPMRVMQASASSSAADRPNALFRRRPFVRMP